MRNFFKETTKAACYKQTAPERHYVFPSHTFESDLQER